MDVPEPNSAELLASVLAGFLGFSRLCIGTARNPRACSLSGQEDADLLRLSPRERMGQPLSVMGRAYFFRRQFDGSGGEAAPGHTGQSRLSRPISRSRRVLSPSGPARRSARDRRKAAHNYVSRRAERYALSPPRGPRAFPIGPAPGSRRGDLSQIRGLAARKRRGQSR
jgi:hypothetical protein